MSGIRWKYLLMLLLVSGIVLGGLAVVVIGVMPTLTSLREESS
jgi:hypothetical protein